MKSIILTILFSSFAFSQGILVSEYYNGFMNETEWVELIVAEENFDVRNFKLRDNSNVDGSPANWQGGVVFKNIDFWQNLPKGLAIVIFLREDNSQDYDTDFSDGLIVLNAEDDTYFEKFCPTCQNDPSDWLITSLNISREADIIQILDNNDANVHAIGHTIAGIGDFQGLSGLMTDQNILAGNSLQVFPGTDVQSYNQGFDNNQDYISSTSNQTRGEANNLGSFEEENADFWHKLRAPEWQNPEVQLTKQQVGFLIDWTEANITENRELFGYMILRFDSEVFTEPINGNIYEEGDLVGSGKVIRISSLDDPTVFNDQSATICGVTYHYLVYLFKYDNGISNQQISYFRGLGRSYNITEFAKGEISRNDIPSFNILSLSGEETICLAEGEDPSDNALTLATTLQETENFTFSWLKDEEIIFEGTTPGEFSQIEISESGRYILRVINDEDCLKLSNNFLDIKIEEKTDYFITVNGIQYFSDTTVAICDNGEDVVYSTNAENPDRVDWYWSNGDGTGDLIQDDQEFFVAPFDEEFFAVVTTGACRDTTNFVSFEYADLSLEIVDFVVFDIVIGLNMVETRSFTLKNTGELSQEFTEDDFDLPQKIEIINPSFPFTLTPGEEIVIRFRFASSEEINYVDNLVIRSDCQEEYLIAFRISASDNEVTMTPSEINFPILIACYQTGIDTTVIISNRSSDIVELSDVAFNEQFRVEGLPFSLQAESQHSVTVTFNTQIIGNYNSIIEIPYERNGQERSLDLAVSGRVSEPTISLEVDIIDFGVVAECENYKDSLILVTNESGIDFTIPNLSQGSFETMNTPLFIPDGESRELLVRFESAGIGISNETISFNLQPCNVGQSISFTGEKRKLDISLEIEIMNFGDNIICNDNYLDSMQNRFVIQDAISEQIVIDSIDAPDFISTSLNVGDEIINGLPFKVYANIDQEVDISDVINIRVAPCNSWYQIPVVVGTTKPELTFNDTLRFEDILVSTQADDQINFQNPSSEDIRFILHPLVEESPFSFDLNEKFLPSGVSGSPIDFSYLSDLVGFDTLLVEVKMTNPCQKTDTLVLIGNTFSEPISEAELIYKINGNQEFTLGNIENVIIGMELTSPDLSMVELQSSQLSVFYDPFVLNLEEFAINEIEGLDINFTHELQLGEIQIETNFENVTDYNFEELATISFEPILGNTINSDLKIIGREAIGNTNFTIKNDSLSFRITGNCQLEERTLAITGLVSLAVDGGEVNQGDLRLNIEIATTDNTQVVLTNLDNSNTIELLNGSLEPGAYSLILDSYNLNSGVYFVRMTSGIAKRQVKFIQIK